MLSMRSTLSKDKFLTRPFARRSQTTSILVPASSTSEEFWKKKFLKRMMYWVQGKNLSYFLFGVFFIIAFSVLCTRLTCSPESYAKSAKSCNACIVPNLTLPFAKFHKQLHVASVYAVFPQDVCQRRKL